MRRVLAVVAVLVGTLTMGVVTAIPRVAAGAATPTTTIYNSTDPTAVGQNLGSLGQEAYAFSKIGNEIQFAPGTSRVLDNVTVQMSSWGCGDSGTWNNDNCVTTPGETFSIPLTINLYAANPDNSPGALLHTATQSVTVPYRPSADATHCTGTSLGEWYNAAAASCFHGIVSDVNVNLGDVTVPDRVIYAVEYQTTSTGDPAIGGPIGVTSCNAVSQGCPYDSLNVALGLDPTNVTSGSNVQTNGFFWNTSYGGNYCDGGAGGVGTFRFDSGCWGDQPPYTSSPYDVPAVQFNAATCTTTCYVSPTGSDSNSGLSGSPFATITHAIGVVSSGGTVDVAAGTYAENVVITKPLTLDGANAGTSAAGPATRSAESVIAGPYSSGNDVSVEVASPNVTVDGFSVQQSTPVTCASCAAFGIEVDPTSSNVTVQNDIVSGMSTSGSSAAPAGNPIGIYVAGNGSTQPNSVSVNHNAISNLTSGGTQHKSAQGILVGDSSNSGSATGLSIQSNRISNVTSASWGAYGLLLNRGTTAAVIRGNTVSAIQGGGWAHGISLDAPEVGPTVVDNAVSGVVGPNPLGGNVADVFIDPGDTTSGSGVIAGNSLTATAAAGLINASSGVIPAAGNWWGCPGGANTAGCTVAAPVATVALTPWIVGFTPDAARFGQPGFWPTVVTPSAAPAITSVANATFYLNQPSTFTVTGTATPAPTFSESGALPVGVSFNGSTGVLSGTPTSFGTFPITFSAHNGAYADAVQSFTLVSTSNTSAITSAPSVQTAVGRKVNFTVTTSGHPAPTFSTVGLPAWLTLTPGKGSKVGTAKLVGTAPAVGGNYTFTIHANNGFGPDTTQTFTVHVLGFSSLASANFSRSGPPTQQFTVTVTGVGTGVTLSATLGGGLAGLTFTDNNNGTATISGQPLVTDQTHLVTVRAQSGAAVTTQKLAIGISN